jgi:hypothetical protein
MIPADLRPRAAVQKVLNQVTGKLSWKELKRQMSDSGVLPEEQDIQVRSLFFLGGGLRGNSAGCRILTYADVRGRMLNAGAAGPEGQGERGDSVVQ